MLEREWGVESNGKLPHLFIPDRTAALVIEFAVEDVPSSELQPRFLSLQWKTCPWAEHSDDILYYIVLYYTTLYLTVIYCPLLCFLCFTVLYCIVWCYIIYYIVYSIIYCIYYIVLHYFLQFMRITCNNDSNDHMIRMCKVNMDMLENYAVPQLPLPTILQQDGAPPHFAVHVR